MLFLPLCTGAHYICYTRDEASTDDESMWIKSDDHVVTRVTLATARDDPSDGWATTPNGASRTWAAFASTIASAPVGYVAS